ncbi:hypothetical protein G9A89_004175 [Geosiphon pyriformis]|nr:hypothetical protein G9A89_004175 [Geosiphon pyriformis]
MVAKDTRVIIVTGANKGIGKAIVKGIAKEYARDQPGASQKLVLYLTARDTERGTLALQELSSELKKDRVLVSDGGLVEIKFFQLNVIDDESIRKFKKVIENEYKFIDVLINNAGIARIFVDHKLEIAQETLETNYYALKKVTEIFLPIIRNPGGRILHLGSLLGILPNLSSEKLQKAFANEQLSLAGIDTLVEKYLKDVEKGVHVSEGWPSGDVSPYVVSKIALISHAKALSRELAAQGKQIHVHVVDPGHIKTDMTDYAAPNAPGTEGADTATFLSLTDESNINSGNGLFWRDRKIRSWETRYVEASVTDNRFFN